jgi:hypothetical protein
MNQLEAVIEKEKGISYSQRDKDLFRSHILILIHQEQESKKFIRKLCLILFLSIGTLSLLSSRINEISNDFTVGLSDAITGDILTIANDFTVGLSDVITGDILTTAIFSYGLLVALLALLKKPDFIFN